MDPTTAAPATSPTSKSSRGKDQIHWSEGVWQALDHAVTDEMMRTRVAAKFLPHFHVHKKRTTVESDVVVVPSAISPLGATPFDPALSVDESAVNRIQEYWTTFRLSVAQVEAEEHEEEALRHETASSHSQGPATSGHDQGHMSHHEGHMSHPHRASTAVSLAMRTANILAQAEDLILFNGQNAVANSPLFQPAATRLVQALDPNLQSDLDLGLLNISPTGDVVINPTGPVGLTNLVQVVPVHPTVQATGGSPPRYEENILNAVASAFSVLQGLGHYGHYALALHTIPYADLHKALATTLIEPVEPISHLIKAGIHGSGTLPPFSIGPGQPGQTGLPTTIGGTPISSHFSPSPLFSPPQSPLSGPNVLYTGVLVSLAGNTMDHVRGRMEDHLDVIVTFNQKDQNEQYRFRVVERVALRLKDPSAVIVLLFLDS
jgi:hypothetical protein